MKYFLPFFMKKNGIPMKLKSILKLEISNRRAWFLHTQNYLCFLEYETVIIYSPHPQIIVYYKQYGDGQLIWDNHRYAERYYAWISWMSR